MPPMIVLFRPSRTRTLCAAACVGLVLGLLGCGPGGPTRIALSGKVTQGGAPVATGAISLVPASGHRGVAANTAIQQGRYQFSPQDGPGPGPYKVTVLVSFSKDELLKRRQSDKAPQTQWEFEIKVPESGKPTENFQLEAK